MLTEFHHHYHSPPEPERSYGGVINLTSYTSKLRVTVPEHRVKKKGRTNFYGKEYES